jgi:hypothetical protein
MRVPSAEERLSRRIQVKEVDTVQTRSLRSALIPMLCLFGLTLATAASANRVEGQLLGVFAGNSSEAALLADLGLLVEELDKVDWPATSSGLLSISQLSLNDDNEPTAGWWDYSGEEIVDLIVVKAGNQYAAYLFDDVITDGMPNLGLWATDALGSKGVSHISAYRVVPEPSTAVLLALGLAGIATVSRESRRSHH